MFSEGSRKQALWLTLGVVLVALLCRLPPMTRSFWLDEVFSVGVAQHTPLEIAREIAPRDVHPPLYYMVLSVWGGTSEFRVRALSLLAGLLQIAALGLVVREMGNARAGWIAAYLAAAAHPLCWPSYEARSFALMNLFATLAWFFLVRSLKKGGRWPWIALGVCMAGTLYTFYYGFFALLALGALFLCSRPTRRQWLGFLAASGLAYLLFFPWVHVLLDQMSRGGPGGWLDPLGPVQTIKHHFFHVTPWRQLSWFGSAFVGALLVLAYRRRERHTPDANRWLAATLAMTLVLALSLVTTNLLLGFFSVRYSTFLAAPWIALFALAMLRIRAGSAWDRVLVATVLALALQTSIYRTFHKRTEDWRSVAADISKSARDRDVVAVLKGGFDHCLEFYAPGSLPPLVGVPRDLPGVDPSERELLLPEHFARARPVFEPYERVWIVSVPGYHRPGFRDELLREFLRGASYREVERREYDNIVLELYAR